MSKLNVEEKTRKTVEYFWIPLQKKPVKPDVYSVVSSIHSNAGLLGGYVWIIDRYEKKVTVFFHRREPQTQKYGGRDDNVQSTEEYRNILERGKNAVLLTRNDQYLIYTGGNIRAEDLQLIRDAI